MAGMVQGLSAEARGNDASETGMRNVTTAEDVRQHAYTFYRELGRAHQHVYMLLGTLHDFTAADIDALDTETVRVLTAWQAIQKVLVAYQQQEANDARD